MNQILCHFEATTTNLEKHSFKMSFPLSFCDAFGMLHDLTCTLRLWAHLKVLRVFKHSHRHLLWRHFVAAAFNDLSRTLVLTKTELDACCDEPHFPLDVVRAVLYRVAQKAYSLITLAHTIVGLRCFDIDLPVKLFRHILEHFIEDSLEWVKSFLTTLFVHFLIKPQVLEPQRAVLTIWAKALRADIERLL